MESTRRGRGGAYCGRRGDVAARPLAGLALCAGVGGLELGLQLALGRRYRTVGYVEREAFAASVLVARMADQALEPAPVWDDLETFDGTSWRGRVDLISAGFPCQPFSAAGRGRGIEDDRWLWPHVARVISEASPGFVFCENVPPLVRRGLHRVLDDLAALGFDVQWTRLAAAAVGATHRRDRLWILAYRHGQRLPSLRRRPDDVEHDPDGPSRAALADSGRSRLEPQPRGGVSRQGPHARRPPAPDHQPQRDGEGLADTQGDTGRARLREGPPSNGTGRIGLGEPPDSSGDLADPTSPRRQGRLHRPTTGQQGPPQPGDGLPLWPPGPDDHAAWAEIAAVDGPQPSVRRVADGLAHRVDRLHAIGNGVVPLVAAHAFIGLAHRAGLLADEPGSSPAT